VCDDHSIPGFIVVHFNIDSIVWSESFYDLFVRRICNGCEGAILARQGKKRRRMCATYCDYTFINVARARNKLEEVPVTGAMLYAVLRRS
jgi:hypothetical protein